MMGPVVAHLNSGPRDDEVIVLPPGRDIYFVAKPAERLALAQLLEEARPERFRILGTYRLRCDALSQPVPHDLESVEFDWAGWEA